MYKRTSDSLRMNNAENAEISSKRSKIDIIGKDVKSLSKSNTDDASLPTDEDEFEALDERAVKKTVLHLEKMTLKNQEMRIKFAGEPMKFMESEVELDVAIQEMHALATAPHHYPLLVECKAVETLVQLLLHENTDISAAVLNLLQASLIALELTYVDTLNESVAGANKLIDALIQNQFVQVMVNNLDRLDETIKDEADAVHNTFAVFENILEIRPEIADLLIRNGIVTWILNRLKAKSPFDGNRLFCSEILAVLLQTSVSAREVVHDSNGIDILLQQMAMYKRTDPGSADEMEYMENIFDCVCAALMYIPNKNKFLEAEGLHLINLMLKESKQSREGALKVLDYVMTGLKSREQCIQYVGIFGLRTLFPLFMRPPVKSIRKNHSIKDHEEHVCSIIASLFKNCQTEQRLRLFKKFDENDHEKLERLIELHFKYTSLTGKYDSASGLDAPTNETEEEERYLERLANGLFTLQLVDYILAELLVHGPMSIRKRTRKIFSMRRAGFESVHKVLLEYANSLGDAEEGSPPNGTKEYVMNLAASLRQVVT
ncbi:beta catenin protein 1 like [Trichuris trichiura]|uniref:Beta-catenin-like protein 1 n=1 Tax=Trichuris trichiura TaxID=36087 RepID=A0A077ZK90_TRITR|nr:beta catenin protein 1 like [Trichuris trichiura]